MIEQRIYIQGMVLNEEMRCSLADLCSLCGVNAELIHDMIEEGIITPEGPSMREWCFTSVAVKRVQVAMRLQRDLRVNLPGCALALDLLDELEELRRLSRRR
ncbi:chaperone modulator CbpM [Desulfobulbus elongatus]|uniref:chaperone modulator CbpM n=1 Tax=Desulfobulbus elongatus TaxID=53332 RepID=UPI0004837608|nr:chaperone modulator CbpM [Desulfobulbus elongatus]